MTSRRHHAGEDIEDVSLADVREESAAADKRADALLSGEYTVERIESPDAPASEDVGTSACRWCRETFANAGDEASHCCTDRRQFAVEQQDTDDTLLEPGVHELGAKLLFSGDGLSPFYAIASEFDQCLAEEDESDDVGSFHAAGDEWSLNHDEEKVKYWQSPIAADGEPFDQYTEFQIGVVADDSVGRRRITFQFRVAQPNLTHVESGDPIGGVPDDLPEGIRVQVDSANVDFQEVLEVLQALADELSIDPSYFARDRLHGWSRIYNLAMYVRIRRCVSEEQVVAVDTGLLERLAEFAQRQRGRGSYTWDHEEIRGHRVAVEMCRDTRQKFLPWASVGALTKSYHMKNPQNAPSTDPTTHPKLEIQFSSEYSPVGSIPIDADAEGYEPSQDLPDGYDITDLETELDEWLLNCLQWAGLPLRADPNVYITDQYWDPSESRRDRRVVDDPMPTLREREERLAEYHVMREDATPSERDVLASLADGGKLDVDEVSESADVSERTVYRAAETFETIVDVSDRVVQLGDEVVRDKVSQLVSSLSNATEWVEDSLETIRERRGTYIDDDSAFARWMRTYGVNLDRSGAGQDELALHVGHFDLVEIRKVLREGLRAARVTGHNLHDLLLDSAVSYYDTDGHRRRDEIPFAIQGNSIAIKGALLEQIG